MRFQHKPGPEQSTSHEVIKALADHDLIEKKDEMATLESLQDFENSYRNISGIFSERLKRECIALIKESKNDSDAYDVDIIITTHRPDLELLHRSMLSAAYQIGVRTRIILSIDEASQADIRTISLIAEDVQHITGCPIIISSSGERQGVGRCRNRGLSLVRSSLYTSLDDDDVFHPLRCLHAALALKINKVEWLGTGYCRYNYEEKKVYLVNYRISWWGHNSFIADKLVLEKYGYLAHLKKHEDTEFMQRISRFGATMGHIETVGHYLHTSISPDYNCLSIDMRKNVEKIENHPYLCGSYTAEITTERKVMNETFEEIYSDLKIEDLPLVFTP